MVRRIFTYISFWFHTPAKITNKIRKKNHMKTLKKALVLVLAAMMFIGVFAVAAGADFVDIDQVTPEYRRAIDVLSDLGLVNGYPDGTLKPKDTITRAELTKILFVAVTGKSNRAAANLYAGNNTFTDVAPKKWYAGYVNYAAKKGWVVGYGDGTFGPDDPIKGCDALVIILRVLGYDRYGELKGSGYKTRATKTARKLGLLVDTDPLKADYLKEGKREEVFDYLYRALYVQTMKLPAVNEADTARYYYGKGQKDYIPGYVGELKEDGKTKKTLMDNFGIVPDEDHGTEEPKPDAIGFDRFAKAIDAEIIVKFKEDSDYYSTGEISDAAYTVDHAKVEVVLSDGTSGTYDLEVKTGRKPASGGKEVNYAYVEIGGKEIELYTVGDTTDFVHGVKMLGKDAIFDDDYYGYKLDGKTISLYELSQLGVAGKEKYVSVPVVRDVAKGAATLNIDGSSYKISKVDFIGYIGTGKDAELVKFNGTANIPGESIKTEAVVLKTVTADGKSTTTVVFVFGGNITAAQ